MTPTAPPSRKPPPGRRAKPARAPGLGFLTGRLTRQIVWGLASKMTPHGVMPAQFPVLRVLYRLETSTQMELARLCGVEQPSMAATLVRMEKAGLIVRVPDPEDARRRLVRLTPHGEEVLHIMTDAAHDVYDEAVAGLSDAEVDQFLAVCARLSENLERLRYGERSAQELEDRRLAEQDLHH